MCFFTTCHLDLGVTRNIGVKLTIGKVACCLPFGCHLQGELEIGIGVLVMALEPIGAAVALERESYVLQHNMINDVCHQCQSEPAREMQP